MTTDIVTMMTKEWREFFAPGGSRRGGVVSLLIFVGIFGIVFPLEGHRTFLTSPIDAFYYGIAVPLSLVMGIIADAFAGERERHTLETLLASRLSDRSILFGKLCAVVIYSWVLSVITSLIAVVVANLTGRGGTFAFYPSGIFASIIAFSLLVSLFYAGLGTLLSLRAETVRQVQQALTVGFLVVFLVPVLIFELLSPATRAQFSVWALSHLTTVGVIGCTALLVVDVILVGTALARFQRARLILS